MLRWVGEQLLLKLPPGLQKHFLLVRSRLAGGRGGALALPASKLRRRRSGRLPSPMGCNRVKDPGR
eukprot:1762128-Pyramimonas_sp.AAC.1